MTHRKEAEPAAAIWHSFFPAWLTVPVPRPFWLSFVTQLYITHTVNTVRQPQTLDMDSEICSHKDVRQIDDLRFCMSCGETLHLWQSPQPSRSPGPSSTLTICDVPHGLAHSYSDLRLSHGTATRMVVLFPGQRKDPLHCTIAIVDPYKENYDALSYTWATEDGDANKTGRIHCPDGVIAITENCDAALRQLRLPTTPRQLWVDAICIDQGNTKERNHQVGLMGDIFKLASTVHMCIQDTSRNYKACICWITESSGANRAYPPSAVTTQLHELFSRRYFSRVWVINTPEYVVALP
jgi:hypothetical protein